MKRIVVNDAFGSCYLSLDALYLLLQLGFPLTRLSLAEAKREAADFDIEGPDGFYGLKGDYSAALYKDGQVYCYAWGNRSPEAQALRSHPALVKMTELLGPRATHGRFGRLSVVDVADDALFRIRDYDGAEGVELYSADDYVTGLVYNEPTSPSIPQVSWFAT